jgi:hypothetical protein
MHYYIIRYYAKNDNRCFIGLSKQNSYPPDTDKITDDLQKLSKLAISKLQLVEVTETMFEAVRQTMLREEGLPDFSNVLPNRSQTN